MEILRPVNNEDIDDLVELAGFLDTVNFPNDREKLEEDICISMNSFSEKCKPEKSMYQFVLEDREKNKVIGVSKIIAHHGTPEKPHYYWQITYDKRESKTIGIGITHQVLTLGKDTQGHTEIAGIIVHPKFQGKKLGKQLFYIRFLFIALNREKFLNSIISELLPPLTKDEKSVLWEAYGRKFTGLTYQEADQLSHDNKEFIEALFPQHKIYTCLLPLKARQVIGKVGDKSKPVKYLAEINGFEFLQQIDPFDGGPHFGSKTDEVLALKNITRAPCTLLQKEIATNPTGLLCKTSSKKENFIAVQCAAKIVSEGQGSKTIQCPNQALKILSLKEGDTASFLPYTPTKTPGAKIQ